MSVSYYAITFLGCQIDSSLMYKQKTIRVCRQDNLNNCQLEQSKMDYKDFKSCPFCSNSIWEHTTDRIDNYEDYMLVGDSTHTSQAVRVDFVEAELEPSKMVWYAGHLLQKVDEYDIIGQTEDIDLNTRKTKLRLALTQLGMWDEARFGLYTILRCSY